MLILICAVNIYTQVNYFTILSLKLSITKLPRATRERCETSEGAMSTEAIKQGKITKTFDSRRFACCFTLSTVFQKSNHANLRKLKIYT